MPALFLILSHGESYSRVKPFFKYGLNLTRYLHFKSCLVTDTTESKLDTGESKVFSILSEVFLLLNKCTDTVFFMIQTL